MRFLLLSLSLLSALLLSNCASSGGGASTGYKVPAPNLKGPSVSQRAADIASEPKGDYWVGRRYYVENTRFWGYIRRPGQPWSTARLVVMNEDLKRTPDRRQEGVKNGFGFDSNYEYRLAGRLTGDRVYEPNTNQILPEFKLSGYQLTNPNPGWLFSPADKYHPNQVTMKP